MITSSYEKIFSEFKTLLIEEMVIEFGEDSRCFIEDKIKELIFVFAAPPDEDYKLVQKNPTTFSKDDERFIKIQYEEFQKIKGEVRGCLLQDFILTLEYFFKIPKERFLEPDSKDIISLFTDSNFQSSFIDSFSTKNISLVRGDETPTPIKEMILKNQNIFLDKMKKYKVNIHSILPEDVDYFLNARNYFVESYQQEIMYRDSFYMNSLKEKVKEKYQALKLICFSKNSHHATIRFPNQETLRYVFFPVNRYKLRGINAIDVSLVHEAVHGLQTESQNSILAEIEVQRHAIQIVKRLHDKGVFIFDDRKNYQTGGYSAYEHLIPFVEAFLTNHQEQFNYQLLYDNFDYLGDVFGPSWHLFSSFLETFWQEFVSYFQTGASFNMSLDDSLLQKYMIDMTIFYENRKDKDVIKQKRYQ